MRGQCVRRADGHVVEDAEAHGAGALGVVSGRTDGAERRLPLTATDEIDGIDDGARRVQRSLDRMRIERRIRIEVAEAARRSRRADGVDVGTGVDASKLLARRGRRLVARNEPVESKRDHVIADRRQPFGTFRVVGAHFVQRARGMSQVGESGQGVERVRMRAAEGDGGGDAMALSRAGRPSALRQSSADRRA
jgi:hypothetical protein